MRPAPAAIFLLGALCGGIVATHPQPASAAETTAPPEDRWQVLTLADYRGRLDLTPDQVAALKPVFDLTRHKLALLRANTADRVAELVREMNRQVMTELNPEQQMKLRKLIEARRHR